MVRFVLDVPDFGDDRLTVLCLCHWVQVLQILVEERCQVSDVLRVRLAAFCQEVHQLEKVILKLVLVRSAFRIEHESPVHIAIGRD